MLACLLLYYIGFTSYDVYFTTKQQQEASEETTPTPTSNQADTNDPDTLILSNNGEDDDEIAAELAARKRKSMYETDPDLVWDDRDQRQRETEDQLSLQKTSYRSHNGEEREEHLLLKSGKKGLGGNTHHKLLGKSLNADE